MSANNKSKPSGQAVASSELFGVGKQIRFLKTLDAQANEDHPGHEYARKGELGTITGHGTREGYWVRTDSWATPFGASADEFEIVTPNEKAER